ncbi:MAG: regulatory protein RecX [Bacteroidota bacterium]
MENKPKKIITPLVAIKKAEAYCAYQERCQQEVRDKLYTLDQDPENVDGIIVQLIESGFLNEERFAMAYVRGKFKQKQWGRVKIKQGLKFKKISDYLIKKALSSIDSEEYYQTLKTIAEKKHSEIKETNEYKRKYKLIGILVSKGFESDIVSECIDELLLHEK